MKDRKLIIKFRNGKTCKIPAYIIAEDRAKYYSVIDGYDDDSQEFLDEVQNALDDELLIFEWIENNMKWEELQHHIEDIEEDVLDLENDWYSGDRTLSVNW